MINPEFSHIFCTQLKRRKHLGVKLPSDMFEIHSTRGKHYPKISLLDFFINFLQEAKIPNMVPIP